jgi:hypothetical protein
MSTGTGLAGRMAAVKLPPRVQAYLEEVIRSCSAGGPVISVVLFGSASMGGYAAGVSDVDLLLVLRDDAANGAAAVSQRVSAIEERHGLGKARAQRRLRLEEFADRITANGRACFVCTRADLLSGEPARILGIPRSQAIFVDRVAIPSIVASGVTVWGEHLLGAVPLPPIRRRDTWIACFSLVNQVLFSAAVFPALPKATKYAMDALKRSVHNCYFCYHLRPAPLATEVAFFRQRPGGPRVLERLMELRQDYRSDFRFVLGCLPGIASLHLRTALDNRFPRLPADGGRRTSS